MTSTIHDQRALVDPRAVGALPQASADVVAVWDRATSCAAGIMPGMGLLAGDRPIADVEVLAGAFAVVEYELARPGSPPETAWPGNNGSPWTIRTQHRTRWRL